MLKMNRKGFTLVELLVVLAILGLLAGIGIPQYMNTMKRSRHAADVAAINTVQEAVSAFLAETGQTGPIAELKVGGESPTKGTSILTNTEVTFASFLQGGAFPQLKTITVTKWGVDANGKVTTDPVLVGYNS